jgi:hypothetical protein
VLAVFAFVLPPNFPKSKTGSQRWLLTEEERQVAIERIAVDCVTQEANRSVFYRFKLAVLDYRTWAFVSDLWLIVGIKLSC